MQHLTPGEIEAYAADAPLPSDAARHLEICAECARRGAAARRFERALHRLERAEPNRELSARILAQLPAAAQVQPVPAPWLAPLTVAVALVGLALSFLTAFDLRANGAFDLLATYSSQPQIVTSYPSAAWDALTAAVPWAMLAASSLALLCAVWLVYRLTGGLHLAGRARN